MLLTPIDKEENTITINEMVMESKSQDFTTTIAAGKNQNFDIDATRAGWTPVGIVGISLGSAFSVNSIAIRNFYTTGNTARIVLRNTGTGTLTFTDATVTLRVLYVKSTNVYGPS